MLPQWFNEAVGIRLREFMPPKRNFKSQPIYELIHNPANSDTDLTSFKQLTGICPLEKDEEFPPLITVHLRSVKEARTLAILVALLTCRYLRSKSFFIQLMSPSQIIESLLTTE